MTIHLNNKMHEQLIQIVELHKGWFDDDVNHILSALKGVKSSKYIDEEVKTIIDKVEQSTNITHQEMSSRNRQRNTVVARQYAIYQIYEELHHYGYSLTEIGKMFNRDHATVIYSVKIVREGLKHNDFFFKRINERYEELANCTT